LKEEGDVVEGGMSATAKRDDSTLQQLLAVGLDIKGC
jgi:hypothetical protein